MGRSKVSVEYIQKDKKRSTTYEKWKKGLEKEEEVGAVIKLYVSGSREENAKRRLNLEQGLALANKKKKSKSDPPLPQPQPPYPSWHLDGLSRDDLLNLASLLDCKLRQVEERMMMMMRPPSSLFYNNNPNELIPVSAAAAPPVNGGDHAMMMMWPMSTASSSSAYDPNSYLPENNGFPRPHPLTAFYNHPPPLGPGLKPWASTTKIFAAMEVVIVSDVKTQDNKENIVPTSTTPLLSSPPSEISSKKKNTAARWRRMRVPLGDITNLFNSTEAQPSSSFLPTYHSVDFMASDLNPRKRKAENDDLKHLHNSRSLRMGFR